MMDRMLTPPHFFGRRCMLIESDFASYASGGDFTTVASDSGTAAVGDGIGGVLVLSPSDGTVGDNDETYLKSTNEVFLFSNNRPMVAEAIIQWAQSSTNKGNVAFGFMNAVAADSILDNGGGPKASFSGAVIYTVDGGTVWRCRSSIGTSYTDNITDITAGNSLYQRLSISCDIVNGYAEITYWHSGVNQLASSSSAIIPQQMRDATTGRPIRHRFDITSATEMNLFIGSKNGGANNHEVVNIDRLCGAQLL